ncbi:MAG: hypothetical protein HKN87_21470 [Saprospiraceae bacterium]|nr:hypothetical protein [Saprospiraceae bacterium]
MLRFLTCVFSTATFILFLSSCAGEGDQSVREQARESLRDIPAGSVTPPSAVTNPAAAAVPTGGVQHYVCPNNCEGSGGPAQANCPVCGSAYEHNQAYHAQQQQSIQTSPITPGSPPATTITPGANPITPEPAVNAAGVYHYTCPDGHAGGAGSAAACATCGKTLVHNTAYHN